MRRVLAATIAAGLASVVLVAAPRPAEAAAPLWLALSGEGTAIFSDLPAEVVERPHRTIVRDQPTVQEVRLGGDGLELVGSGPGLTTGSYLGRGAPGDFFGFISGTQTLDFGPPIGVCSGSARGVGSSDLPGAVFVYRLPCDSGAKVILTTTDTERILGELPDGTPFTAGWVRSVTARVRPPADWTPPAANRSTTVATPARSATGPTARTAEDALAAGEWVPVGGTGTITFAGPPAEVVERPRRTIVRDVPVEVTVDLDADGLALSGTGDGLDTIVNLVTGDPADRFAFIKGTQTIDLGDPLGTCTGRIRGNGSGQATILHRLTCDSGARLILLTVDTEPLLAEAPDGSTVRIGWQREVFGRVRMP